MGRPAFWGFGVVLLYQISKKSQEGSFMLDELRKTFEIEEIPEEKEVEGYIKVVLNRIKNCDKMVFAKKCKECGSVFYVAIHCHNRLCLECAKKRARKEFYKYKDWVEGWKWASHMVLTLRVDGDLSEMIDKIQVGFKKVRRKFKIKKYIGTIEIVRKPEGWYVHLHSLIDKKWIKVNKLRKYWEKHTGSYIVYVKRVKDREVGLLEVLKYVLKGLRDIEEKDMVELIRATYRRRFLIVGGSSLDNIELSEQNGNQEDIKILDKCYRCGGKLAFLGVFEREDPAVSGGYEVFFDKDNAGFG